MTAVRDPAESRLTGRRVVDPAVERRFHASMRNDFLTPRGTPYKWQEMTASLRRTVVGGGVATVVPVRYRWERVDARTGNPKTSTDPREWTFARGQSFSSMLLHAEAGGPAALPEPAAGAPVALDVSYPQLPKSPAVDLLLMLSWDVVTFEMMCTHLITTPGLRDVGGRAELERISGSWAELTFSDPGAVAVFRNERVTAEHLGQGRFAGRPSAVYSSRCLDCGLDVRSGPVTQRGRSSYWVTLQVDVETGDLLCADMTEMIVATLTGPDGTSLPVQKRRSVRMWVDAPSEEPAVMTLFKAAVPGPEGAPATVPPQRAQADPAPPTVPPAQTVPPAPPDPAAPPDAAAPPAPPPDATAPLAPPPDPAAPAAPPVDPAAPAAPPVDPALLAEAVRLAERVADFVAWQSWSLSYLPEGMADLAQMGFRSVVGTDLAASGTRVGSLLADLRAMAGGESGVDAEALPAHRRHLEGLLAFGQIAVDGQTRLLVPDEAGRIATRERLDAAGADLTELLALLERLERYATTDRPWLHRS